MRLGGLGCLILALGILVLITLPYFRASAERVPSALKPSSTAPAPSSLSQQKPVNRLAVLPPCPGYFQLITQTSGVFGTTLFSTVTVCPTVFDPFTPPRKVSRGPIGQPAFTSVL